MDVVKIAKSAHEKHKRVVVTDLDSWAVFAHLVKPLIDRPMRNGEKVALLRLGESAVSLGTVVVVRWPAEEVPRFRTRKARYVVGGENYSSQREAAEAAAKALGPDLVWDE